MFSYVTRNAVISNDDQLTFEQRQVASWEFAPIYVSPVFQYLLLRQAKCWKIKIKTVYATVFSLANLIVLNWAVINIIYSRYGTKFPAQLKLASERILPVSKSISVYFLPLPKLS